MNSEDDEKSLKPLEVEATVRDHLMRTFGIDEIEATAFAKKYIAEVESHRHNTKILNEMLEIETLEIWMYGYKKS
jgi:uncharacterized protein YeaO (DUF488 family)